MSTKCVVEGCEKWSFQGGLCRGHLIVAPQAATPKAAAAAAALASAPRQPSSCPLTLTGPPAPSGAQGGREKGGGTASRWEGGGSQQQASISSKNASPPPPPPHMRANTVQQDERDALDRAVGRQALRDDHRRGEEERTGVAMEFLSLHACVRRGCAAIRLPQSIVFDNSAVQAKLDAAVAGACHYHPDDAFVARDTFMRHGSEAILQWPCCGEHYDTGGCMLAPGHDFPAQGVRFLQKRQNKENALQLALAVIDSVAAGQGDAEAQFRLGQLHSNPLPPLPISCSTWLPLPSSTAWQRHRRT